MKTSYFTFGQNHRHSVTGFTYDKNVVVKITSPNPRDTMFGVFGDKWAMEYSECPDLDLFPRGVHELNLRPLPKFSDEQLSDYANNNPLNYTTLERWLARTVIEDREALRKLRDEIEPMAAQIICPKENTFTKQLRIIDERLKQE